MESRGTELKIRHYQAACAGGLALVFAGQFVQGIELPNFLVLAAGIAVLVTRRPVAPLVFLVLLAAVQLVHAATRQAGLAHVAVPRLFAPAEVILSAGTLLFVGCAYRLHGFTLQIVPPHPRLMPMRSPERPAPPVPPQTRAAVGLRAEELAGFLFALPVFVVAGQALWSLLQRPFDVTIFKPPLLRVVLLVWLVVVGVVSTSAVFSFWRRARSEASTARLYLQETVWRDLRRETNRLARWYAWGRRRRSRRPPDA
jgi:hypothetical protein